MKRYIKFNLILFITVQISFTTYAGTIEPPAGNPEPTMVTLEQIYKKAEAKALISNTYQYTQSGTPGQLPSEARFTDNLDGTVTDQSTGLIWLKNANYLGTVRNWPEAVNDCKSLSSGIEGLTDGSTAGDWRLPNINELKSIIDFSQAEPALPDGHPFTHVSLNSRYWTATTYSLNTEAAWLVHMGQGNTIYYFKTLKYSVWPVRDKLN